MTSNGQNAYAVTSNQTVICYVHNVRLTLVLLTCLLKLYIVSKRVLPNFGNNFVKS